jgi:hypothetical protein
LAGRRLISDFAVHSSVPASGLYVPSKLGFERSLANPNESNCSYHVASLAHSW